MAVEIQPRELADQGIAGETAVAPPAARARRPRLRGGLEIALLTGLAIVMLFPVLWMLETSLKEQRDIYAVPAKVFDFAFTLEHFKDVFSSGSPVVQGFKNSVLVAGVSTVLATLLGVPGAWAYSRFRIRGKQEQLF